jgi:hypothetical protein
MTRHGYNDAIPLAYFEPDTPRLEASAERVNDGLTIDASLAFF